jgi:hypothetical protein
MKIEKYLWCLPAFSIVVSIPFFIFGWKGMINDYFEGLALLVFFLLPPICVVMTIFVFLYDRWRRKGAAYEYPHLIIFTAISAMICLILPVLAFFTVSIFPTF